MIIAVPIEYFLEDEGKPSHLAFLSTVNNKFVEIDGEHVWDSWEYLTSVCTDKNFLQRVEPLCPEWFFSK